MAAIEVSFAVLGLKEVKAAFESVTDAQKRAEKAVVTGVSNETRTRQQGADKARQIREKEYAELFKQIEKAEKAEEKRFNSITKRLDKEQKTVEKTEAAKSKAIEKANAQSSKAEEKRFNDTVRRLDQEVRAAERAEERKLTARTRADRRALDIQLNSAKMAGQIAEQSVNKEIAARRRLTGAVGGAVSGAIGGVVGMGARLGGSLLALGGGFSTADAVSNSLGAEKAAVALSNSAYIPGENIRPDKGHILSRARSVEASTNISKKELIEGWQSYVAKSSDFKGGDENLGFFARLSKASGSKFGDIAGAAGILRAQNDNLSASDMRGTMQNIVGQGKLGAVEISELAHIAGRITASSADYAGSQTINQRKLLGLSQIAFKTAGSAEGTSTVIERLGGDALKNRDSMPAGTFDKQGNIVDVNKLIHDVFKDSHGNIGKIGDMGFRQESIKLFQALAPTYNDAEAKKKGSGVAAIDAQVSRFTGAGYSDEDVQTDFAAVMATNAEKIDTAFTHIRDVLEQKLTPYIERFSEKLPELMPKIERLIDSFGRLGEYLLDNPYKGLGAILGAAVTKDVGLALATAGLKAVFQTELAAALGTAVIPIAAMAVTAQVVKMWADDSAAKQGKDVTDVLTTDNETRDILGRIRGGTATPEDKAKIVKLQGKTDADMKDVVRRQNEVANDGDDTATGKLLHKFTQFTDMGEDEAGEAQRGKLAALEITFKSLAENANLLDKAMKELTDSTGKAPKPENNQSRSRPMTDPSR